MEIKHKDPNKKYGIQKIGEKHYRIVKVLKDYCCEEDAIKDMTILAMGEITEEELINKQKDANEWIANTIDASAITIGNIMDPDGE